MAAVGTGGSPKKIAVGDEEAITEASEEVTGIGVELCSSTSNDVGTGDGLVELDWKPVGTKDDELLELTAPARFTDGVPVGWGVTVGRGETVGW